jgi:hypothetical protein
MPISNFFRERAQAIADHVVAVLLIAGGDVVVAFAIHRYALVLGLDPLVAMILAWVVALIVAVAVSLLLKPKQKPGQPNLTEPAPPQQLSQSGIVNAPRFEFNPRIEVNPTFIQKQSQEQTLAEKMLEATVPSELVVKDAYVVHAFVSAWGKLQDFQDEGSRPCDAAQVDFQLKAVPGSDEWSEVRTEVAFYDVSTIKPLKNVNDGVWRTTHPEETEVNIPFRRGSTKPFVVALDIAGEGLTTYEHALHDPMRPGLKIRLHPKRRPLSANAAIVQVHFIGEYYSAWRFDQSKWFKLSNDPRLTIEEIDPPDAIG